MKPTLLIFHCFLLVACMGQNSGQADPARVQMLADFDTLRHALEEAHGGLTRYLTKDEVKKLFDESRKRTEQITSRREFIAHIAELLAALRDGHLRLDFDNATTTALSAARTFPLRVLIEKDRLMVMYNDTPDDSVIRPGMEIISINGQPPTDLIKKILPKIPGDGYIETGKLRRLERGFANNYWLTVDTTATFNISARDEKGKIFQTTLTGIASSDRENNRRKNPVNNIIRANMEKLDGDPQNISLSFLGDDIAYMRIRGFEGDQFNDQLDKLFSVLHDKKTKALILDLRGNGGGVDNYGAYLVAQFMNKPFRYFDRIHLTTISPSFTTWRLETSEQLKNGVTADPAGGFLVKPNLHSGVGEQQPGKHPFAGKAFVLTDGFTFSTAADVTAVLKNANKAVFVGEETGGGFEGNTSGLNAQVNLPYSGLKVRVQMYEYFNAVTTTNRGRGTLPDYVVEKKIADLLKGIDLALNKAVELARQ